MSADRPVTRYIQPLGMRVLVRIIPSGERSESGLYLPAGAKEKMLDAFYGEVVEVARAHENDDEADLGTNVSGIPCGAKILFPKDEGIRVPWDDNLRLLDVKHVLAKVEEVDLEETH
ncbi:MAG: co-chaperone GroES [Pseudomonadota bacterium]